MEMCDNVNTITQIITQTELHYLQDASSCTTFITTINTPPYKHLSKLGKTRARTVSHYLELGKKRDNFLSTLMLLNIRATI